MAMCVRCGYGAIEYIHQSEVPYSDGHPNGLKYELRRAKCACSLPDNVRASMGLPPKANVK